jgi:peptidoglycan/LPS O-acetylase OafA/YrhL
MATQAAYRRRVQRSKEGPVSFVRKLCTAVAIVGVTVLATPLAASAQTTTNTSTSFNPTIFLVFGVIFGIACALIANSKGRSPVLWGVLGFLFGLIPLIIILVMKRKSPPMYAGGQPMNPPPPPPPPPV